MAELEGGPSEVAFAADFCNCLADIIRNVKLEPIGALAAAILDVWRESRCIFLCGNGGSASTASHFAADLCKFTQHKSLPPIRAMSLCENIPLISALTNDVGHASVFVEQLRIHYRPGDMLIALSVHGGAGGESAGPWSQNLIQAARYVREHRGIVASLTGFGGGPLAEISDVAIIVPPTNSGILTTPIVESLHVAIHHLICDFLRQRLATTATGDVS